MISLVPLLVVASLVAALAFFMAGWLLRRPGMGPPAGAEKAWAEQLLALKNEVLNRQTEQQQAIAALAEARRQRDAETQARANADDARSAAEQERDQMRTLLARSTERERTLADRLRAAEGHASAALEQIETNAAGWDAQCRAAKAEHEQREESLLHQIEELRSTHAASEGSLRRELDELRSTHAASEEGLRRELDELRSAYAAERDAWQDKLADAEAEGRARLVAAERDMSGAVSALDSERQQIAQQLEHLRLEQEKDRQQSQRLVLALQTAESALAAERAHAQAMNDALRAAEARLSELDRLVRENAELRDEQSRVADQAALESTRDVEVRDAKVALATAQAKLAELAQVLNENRRLRDEIAELRAHQGDSAELERVTAAHKQIRLDAELMARRLQELQHLETELVPLRAQAAEAASLLEEARYLRRREKDLEAQLYAAGLRASREMPQAGGESMVQTPVTNMEANLDSLVGEGGPRTAVLADAQGFLIAGAGESFAQEGLAAFAAVASDLVGRARMLLPLADVRSVRVTDANHMILTCHLFDSDGQGLGVATLGPGEATAEKTQQAIVELDAIVSCGADAGEGNEASPSSASTRQ
jgi:hypothetical protein